MTGRARTWTAGWATAAWRSSARWGPPSTPTASTARTWAGSTGTWTPTALACNPHGTAQAGIHALILDAAMNFAINAALPGRDRTRGTLEMKTETMRPAQLGEPYRCAARWCAWPGRSPTARPPPTTRAGSSAGPPAPSSSTGRPRTGCRAAGDGCALGALSVADPPYRGRRMAPPPETTRQIRRR